MKKVAYSALFALVMLVGLSVFIAGCGNKKSLFGATVDPRDPYVGTWIEASTNGKAPTTGQESQVVVAKATQEAAISLSGLIDNVVTANAATAGGYAATDIDTGYKHTFTDGSTAPIYLQNLAITQSGDQLTLNYSLYAVSPKGVSASGKNVQVFKKK